MTETILRHRTGGDAAESSAMQGLPTPTPVMTEEELTDAIVGLLQKGFVELDETSEEPRFTPTAAGRAAQAECNER